MQKNTANNVFSSKRLSVFCNQCTFLRLMTIPFSRVILFVERQPVVKEMDICQMNKSNSYVNIISNWRDLWVIQTKKTQGKRSAIYDFMQITLTHSLHGFYNCYQFVIFLKTMLLLRKKKMVTSDDETKCVAYKCFQNVQEYSGVRRLTCAFFSYQHSWDVT